MSVIQVLWSPPNAPHPNSAPGSHHTQVGTHHFHFPPTGLLDASASFRQHLRTAGRKLSHSADGERGPAGQGSVSSWSPNTDIRQTRNAYHIEIEVPGTTEKETLLVQWLSPSTLIVRGVIERPFVGHGKTAEGAHQWLTGEEAEDGYPNGNASTNGQDSTHERGGSIPKEKEHDGNHVSDERTYQSSTGSKFVAKKTENDGGELKRMNTDRADECADIPMFLLEERKTGPWQRTFTLPHNIEMHGLKARLEGGLLRIEVPITNATEKPGTKIEID